MRLTADARRERTTPAYFSWSVWMMALATPTPDEEALMRYRAKLEVETRARLAEPPRLGSQTMIWDGELQLTRRACEADVYVSTSLYGGGQPALGQAETLPWMFQALSRFQEVDDDEIRATFAPNEGLMLKNFRRAAGGQMREEERELLAAQGRL
eukprot:14423398-Alexandrium_andersonii.AAC.1